MTMSFRCVCVIAMVWAGAALAGERPSVVVIVADDLGWADVGFHDGVIATPSIDRIANEGVRLERFYACPLCSPTRAGLMTGRWPIRFGLMSEVVTPWRPWGMSTAEDTVADMMGRAGYARRGVVGKWHLGHRQRRYHPTSRGFTFFYGHYNGNLDYFTQIREGERDWHRNEDTSRDEGYTTDLIAREAARFIDESPAGEPYFLYVPFNAPHTPLQAKGDDIAKYAEIADGQRRIYAAMVDSMDQAIGRILAAIERRDDAANTLVLFFSDNGGVTRFGSNGPWRAGKGSVYEGGIRVAAAARWPAGGIAGGGRCDARMGYIDVYPTLKRAARFAGDDPNPLDGRDMLDVMRGKAEAPHRAWYSYVAQGQAKWAIHDGPWKLILLGGNPADAAIDEPDRKGPTLELYNLEDDPGEQRDLSGEERGHLARLLTKLQAFSLLRPDGVPSFRDGRAGFKPPKDWKITAE